MSLRGLQQTGTLFPSGLFFLNIILNIVLNSVLNMMTVLFFVVVFFISVSQPLQAWGNSKYKLRCSHAFHELFNQKVLSPDNLSLHTIKSLERVKEFRTLKALGEKMGVHVWLFGGTASSFLYYVKEDFLRTEGLAVLPPQRFDFDFTHIFRQTQDLDIVIDGTPEMVSLFKKAIAQEFPYFLGQKMSAWEVRSLRYPIGKPEDPWFKEALINDQDFTNQNTDSYSVGMIEVTRSKLPVIGDLKNWDQYERQFKTHSEIQSEIQSESFSHSQSEIVSQKRLYNQFHSFFLEDVLEGKIRYWSHPKHYESSRAKKGENPEILSVIRFLVKTFQYEVTIPQETWVTIEKIIQAFNPKEMTNPRALQKIRETSKKLILHSVNLEYGRQTLEKLGLWDKLLTLEGAGSLSQAQSLSWWLNRKPLASQDLGQGSGKTAQELRIQRVFHETKSYSAYESIVRSRQGEANVLVSRENTPGEVAAHGEGFYTRWKPSKVTQGTQSRIQQPQDHQQSGHQQQEQGGQTYQNQHQQSYQSKGLYQQYIQYLDSTQDVQVRALPGEKIVWFRVHPQAREGSDFTVKDSIILFHNKKALEIMPESLVLQPQDLIHWAYTHGELTSHKTDPVLIEVVKRRIQNSSFLEKLQELLDSPSSLDHEKLVRVLQSFQDSLYFSKLLPEEVLKSFFKTMQEKLSSKAFSSHERDLLFYIQMVGPLLPTFHRFGILSRENFMGFLHNLVLNSPFPNIRVEAYSELVLDHFYFRKEEIREGFHSFYQLKVAVLSQADQNLWVDSFQQWYKSSDHRKKRFSVNFNLLWFESIRYSNLRAIEEMSSVVSVNYLNVSRASLLQLAAYYKSKPLLDWLVSHSTFDFNRKNDQGFTEIEQLYLKGWRNLADTLVQNLREKKKFVSHASSDASIAPEGSHRSHRVFSLEERQKSKVSVEYPEGEPFIDFVRIESGSFFSGKRLEKGLQSSEFMTLLENPMVLTTISQPFEVMSVDVTQKLYAHIIKVIQNPTSEEFSRLRPLLSTRELSLNPDPSYFKGEFRPVEQVSYVTIDLWLKILNTLSQEGSSEVQNLLNQWLPGHKKGHYYSRGTNAQWKWLLRLGGSAEGHYVYGDHAGLLSEYAVYHGNSRGQSSPVGSKRPIFYQGKPLYDLHGNVWKLTEDWFGSYEGGLDPLGPSGGTFRLRRGGSWLNSDFLLRMGDGQDLVFIDPAIKAPDTGFRLFRNVLP
jgi:formylglycine-generating enzyme required for sulfatase activity